MRDGLKRKMKSGNRNKEVTRIWMAIKTKEQNEISGVIYKKGVSKTDPF